MRLGALIVVGGLLGCGVVAAQGKDAVSKVWVADQGDGTYKNPVLYADYSDPDAIRVGSDFYLVSSSFGHVPGIPILQSKDLVNWRLVGHVFNEQPPTDVFATVQHGKGAWAPSIRYHNGEFYVFYPDPDYGIYMVKAKSVTGPWSVPLLIKAAPGWIDPCPLWDTDGKAYLVNGLAASRRGVKSAIVISRMAEDGTKLLDEGSILIDGHGIGGQPQDPTLEGPKIYKREGYYYVMAPAGGVPTGWQVVFRSKNIYGPYERKVVLAQGKTGVNGPHQGAWVTTELGEDWFLHFQDQGAYGRVVWLEPMTWRDGWPVVGEDPEHTGVGQPVLTHKKPKVAGVVAVSTPPDSDEFNGPHLGLQWQWEANVQPSWAFPSQALGALRLVNVSTKQEKRNLWDVPNVVAEKFPGPEFTVTTKVTFTSRSAGEETGLIVLGQSYAAVELKSTDRGVMVQEVSRGEGADAAETVVGSPVELAGGVAVFLRAKVAAGAVARFSFSTDGINYEDVGGTFTATPGRWVGAKVGLFAIGPAGTTGERGYADYDWFRLEK